MQQGLNPCTPVPVPVGRSFELPSGEFLWWACAFCSPGLTEP